MAADTETLTAPALTPETLAELERLHAAATKGPWVAEIGRDGEFEIGSVPEAMPVVCNWSAWPHRAAESQANGELIAELRNNAPALIASARRTQQAEAERDACASALARAMRGNKERVDDMEALVTSMEQLAAERDAALKRAEAAERPDMFWWGDDPEQPHQSVHDLIVAFDVQAGEVALVQRASRLPDQWFVWGPQPAEGEDFDAYPGLKAFDTEAEAKAYAATLSQPGAAS